MRKELELLDASPPQVHDVELSDEEVIARCCSTEDNWGVQTQHIDRLLLCTDQFSSAKEDSCSLCYFSTTVPSMRSRHESFH